MFTNRKKLSCIGKKTVTCKVFQSVVLSISAQKIFDKEEQAKRPDKKNVMIKIDYDIVKTQTIIDNKENIKDYLSSDSFRSVCFLFLLLFIAINFLIGTITFIN